MEGDLSKLTPGQKSDLMDKVKTQVFVANFQELLQVCLSVVVVILVRFDLFFIFVCHSLLQRITEKCYVKCVPKPGSSLDSSEKKCLGLCMDRYMDAQNLVARTYAGRVQREQGLQ